MNTRIVYRTISLTDLEAAGFEIAIKKTPRGFEQGEVLRLGEVLPPTEFKDALYFLGLQLNPHLKIQDSCQHVTIDGQRTFNFRFIGEERNDKEWLTSGFASEEAILSSSNMKDMVSHGMSMQKGGDRK